MYAAISISYGYDIGICEKLSWIVRICALDFRMCAWAQYSNTFEPSSLKNAWKAYESKHEGQSINSNMHVHNAIPFSFIHSNTRYTDIIQMTHIQASSKALDSLIKGKKKELHNKIDLSLCKKRGEQFSLVSLRLNFRPILW